MADRKELEVKFVGGGRYDLANLNKRKSGRPGNHFVGVKTYQKVCYFKLLGEN